MFEGDGVSGGQRPRLLIGTCKATAALAVVTYLAAHLVTNGFERAEVTRLAEVIRGPVQDPVTTGSIARSPVAAAARTTRLDPCVLRP